MEVNRFKTELGESIFKHKYAQGPNDTWDMLVDRLIEDVCGTRNGTLPALMSVDDRKQLSIYIKEMKFLPGGRYLYYAGRPAKFYNNCYLLRAEEDTREEWSNVTWRSMSCLMTGGGIGIDYSLLRPAGAVLSRTGGKASGPLPLMQAIDNVGAGVMQGGARRSAIYASLNWQHEDIPLFLKMKNWRNMLIGNGMTVADAKELNFNYKAPMDMTNISVNYDDAWEFDANNEVFVENVRQAMETGEPGFSFNFGAKQNETLRNACTEVTSEDDSDVCNLGSVNMANITDLVTFKDVVRLGSMFLVCGTLRAELPYKKVYEVRQKNRRLGLGLMGIHEWLIQRGKKYEVDADLHGWLRVYRDESERAAKEHCDRFYLSHPVAFRAIAPTGTIGILAGTTTGIEPLFAVAYKRRFLVDGSKWKYKFVVDGAAERVIKEGADPDKLESAADMAMDPERRVRFQADVQDYVDMSISSTINLPAWGTEFNNESRVRDMAGVIARYANRLRGFTCYPDGSRGGQPITPVPYAEAVQHKGVTYDEVDICDITGKGGSCGV
jgi:ribonucleoside-diphosphate reductase alpha chain